MSIKETIVHYDGVIDIRYFPTEGEAKRATKFFGLPHIRPDSTLVASVGNTWEPGAWQKVVDMVEHTNKMGACCWLSETKDPCIEMPYHTLPSMRDAVCMFAADIGFQWLLIVENDVMPEPDMLLRLMKWHLPVVVPYMRDNKTGKPVSNPEYEPNQGIKPIQWTLSSCVLMWTKVLNCFPECMPFGTGNFESAFFYRLLHYGHRVFQDTDTELKIATRPTYPGERESLDELWNFWKQADARRRQVPDRRPIDPEDKREIYLPKIEKAGDEPEIAPQKSN